jgi:hypothetical protein
MMSWEAGVLGALIFAWVGVLGLVAIDLSASMRRVVWAALVLIVVGVPQFGCTREKIVYRDNPNAPTVPEPTPAPVPASLKFPQGVPDSDISIVPGIPTLHDVVNQEIAAMFPACQVYQERCDGQGYSAQSFFNVLNSRLRARGYWAGQHRDGESDEMTVTKDCKGQWENFHAWYYGERGYPLWARTVSSPCAGHACTGQSTSYRGNTVIPAGYCK